MKKTIITLGLLAGMLTMFTGSAFAVVGAEPPPEGMMGITAIMDPSEPVSSDDLLPVDKPVADDILLRTNEPASDEILLRGGDEDELLQVTEEMEIGTEEDYRYIATSAPITDEAVVEKETKNLLSYGAYGLLGAGAIFALTRKKK
ncbi:MAG: hypothetical protein SCK28_05505 [Bacillota bacterium]|nr:hypothetical protein [Bacillota bacterium]